jgi:hypothetical protein
MMRRQEGHLTLLFLVLLRNYSILPLEQTRLASYRLRNNNLSKYTQYTVNSRSMVDVVDFSGEGFWSPGQISSRTKMLGPNGPNNKKFESKTNLSKGFPAH